MLLFRFLSAPLQLPESLCVRVLRVLLRVLPQILWSELLSVLSRVLLGILLGILHILGIFIRRDLHALLNSSGRSTRRREPMRRGNARLRRREPMG